MNKTISPPEPEEKVRTRPSPAMLGSVRPGSTSGNAQRRAKFHMDIVRSLQLHGLFALGILAVALLLAVVCMARMWPDYVAHSLVTIQPPAPTDESATETYMQQQVRSIVRPEILLGAVHLLPAANWRSTGESDQSAAQRLGRILEVKRVGSTTQISIGARATSRFLAAEMANAVAESFIGRVKREPRGSDPQQVELLRQDRNRIQKELDADGAEQADLERILKDSPAGRNAVNTPDGRITQLRAELTKARSESDAARIGLSAMAAGEAGVSAALDAESDAVIASDTGLASLKASLSQRRVTLLAQVTGLKADQPQYKQAADELAQINASLDSMMHDVHLRATARHREKIESELERTSAEEAQLNIQLAKLMVVSGNAAPRLERLSDLTADIERLQRAYSAIDGQLNSLSSENRAPATASIATMAVPPAHASKAQMIVCTLLVIVGGLVLAVVGAVAAHNLDPRIYIATDAERVLGGGLLAQLPDFSEISGPAADEFLLRFASELEHAFQKGFIKNCIFTGLSAGAGVSTLALGAKTMLRRIGRVVVLVDASTENDPLAAPTQDEVMKMRPSARLEKLAAEADRQTLVMADTAPLPLSLETAMLARKFDTVIVILEAGITTRSQLEEVAAALRALPLRSIAFVLNRVSLRTGDAVFRESVKSVEHRVRLHRKSSESWRRAGEPEAPQTETQPRGTSPAPGRRDSSIQAKGRSSEATQFTPAEEGTAQSEVSTNVPYTTGSLPMRGRGTPSRTRAVDDSGEIGTGRAGDRQTGTYRRSQSNATENSFAESEVVRPGSRTPWAGEAYSYNAGAIRPAEQIRSFDTENPPNEDDDLPYSASSRLGSLRNLMASNMLKNTHHEAGNRDREAALEVREERASSRVIQPERRSEAIAEDPEHDSEPVRLAVQPEFLPPRAGMIELDRVREPLRAVATPIKRDTADDIETLPSKRGQYRRRR